MEQKVRVDDQLEISVNRMGINGEGIGYYNKLAIFIDGALPGERIMAKITDVYDNRAVAQLINIIKPSKDRVTPFCPIYHECGGCQTQHFNYKAMLAQKKDILIKSLNRYVKDIDQSIVADTIGMQDPLNYRNKASLPVKKVNGKNKAGMYQRNSNIFIPITDCDIQNKEINSIIKTILRLMDKYNVDSYDKKTKKGYMTHLVVRISENLKEAQVSLIVVKRLFNLSEFIDDLLKEHNEVSSVFEVVNDDPSNHSFFTESIYKLYGKDTIDERLNGYNFVLKPSAFFQLNTQQAHKFYSIMQELASLNKDEIAIDAYAGIAPVSHYIHSNAKKVYAIELNKEAVESARLSLIENKISNVELINEDFAKALKKFKNTHIDVMLFDPPRTGLGSQTINLVKEYKPKRLVYGSCNPSTLAKDLNELKSLYNIKKIVPIDMFPFTSLVESITLLELKTTL